MKVSERQTATAFRKQNEGKEGETQEQHKETEVTEKR